jgi:hypothetical protein
MGFPPGLILWTPHISVCLYINLLIDHWVCHLSMARRRFQFWRFFPVDRSPPNSALSLGQCPLAKAAEYIGCTCRHAGLRHNSALPGELIIRLATTCSRRITDEAY